MTTKPNKAFFRRGELLLGHDVMRRLQAARAIVFAVAASFLLLAGCRKNFTFAVPGVTDTNATAIVFGEDGGMIDFVHIMPADDIARVEFIAPQGGGEIRVVAVGPKVVTPLVGTVVSSKVAEGYFGKVVVEIDNGVISQIEGNGIGSSSPLKRSHLETIARELGKKSHVHPASTVIVHTDRHIRELVADMGGNLTPPDMSPKEKDFLAQAIPALTRKDMAVLSQFVHRNAGDSDRTDTVGDFLRLILKSDIQHYRFMRFDPKHPDNQDKLHDISGDKKRYSVPVGWVLTLYFSNSGDQSWTSADLLVGEDAGQLKFPTMYVGEK